MDRNIERILQSPIMKLASENQARLDSISSATESIVNLSKVAQSLDPAKRLASYIDTEDFITRISKNNLAIDNSLSEVMKSLAEPSILGISLPESIKTNAALINAIEATSLGLKPRTQSILLEGFASTNQIGDLSSIISKATEAFKQYDKFSELESFKAISRLENFPNDKVWTQNYYEAPEITEDSLAKAKNIDAMISDEVSSVDDFNELSEEKRTILLELYQAYYYPIRLNCVVILMWLQVFLDEKLDLTNNTFIFVEKSKQTLSYISNVYRPNPSGVIDGLIGTAIFTLLMKVFG